MSQCDKAMDRPGAEWYRRPAAGWGLPNLVRRGRFAYNCPDYSTVFPEEGELTSSRGDDLKGNSKDTARFLLEVSLREQKNIYVIGACEYAILLRASPRS